MTCAHAYAQRNLKMKNQKNQQQDTHDITTKENDNQTKTQTEHKELLSPIRTGYDQHTSPYNS